MTDPRTPTLLDHGVNPAEISSNSTTSTTATARMANKEEEELPENAKQPVLETIAPPTGSGRTTKAASEGNTSPRSIDNVASLDNSPSYGKMSDAIDKSPPRPQTFNKRSPAGPASASSARHARTRSDEIPRTINGGYVQGSSTPPQPAPAPYPYFGPPLVQHYPMPTPHAQQQQYMMMHHPPPHSPYSSQPRVRNTAEGFSMPEVPNTYAGESRPLLHSNSERNARSWGSGNRRTRRHRKTYSSGPVFPEQPGYGAFWTPPDQALTHANSFAGTSSGPPQSPRAASTRNFDPRGELMNLAQGLRSPRQSAENVSPVLTPVNSIHHTYAGDARIVSWSPATPMTESNASGGGEAIFLAQKRSHRPESSRRRHMRQHSAQLFMEDIKGVPQAPKCRDLVFLLLFVFHLFFLVYLGNLYSKEAITAHPEGYGEVTVYYNNMFYLACVSGGFAVVVSALLLLLMSTFAKYFVQVALCVVITLSFVWGTIGIGLSPKNVVPITGIIALALSVAYAFIVWDRIPFAAANLLTALTAIRTHYGIIFVALFFQAIALGWSIYFCVVCIGIYDSINEGKLALSHDAAIAVYVLLGLSYWWTFQVLSNTVQAITAGVVASWWSNPEDEGIVKQSTFKTLFYSMGSICFGSLFVGPVRVIRQIAVLFRPNSDDASLLCLHECLHCIQSCITSVVESLACHFNAWAFTYIGLYHYGFTEAGSLATELFEKRGWTIIVSDDLVPNVLLMTSLVIGGCTGCFAHLMERLDGFKILSLDEPALVSFWLGMVNGLVLTSVLFSVISSAVNAVLVCFAVSPVDFENNHAELSNFMRSAWRDVWPGALDVVDLRLALAAPGVMPSPYLPNGPPV